jgi:hypothetical protein
MGTMFMARRDQEEPSLRGRLIHVAMIVATFALGMTAWWSLYDGLASGCFKAKYGFICQADHPTTFVIQMTLTAIAGLLYSGGCILASIALWDRFRFRY